MGDQSDSTDLVVQNEQQLQRSIDGFNQPLAEYIRGLNLPTENVLYPVEERKRVIGELRDAISILPYDERTKSAYLSKFTVAIAAGLFDGAVNYLWNETVDALHRLICRFDLQYFYSVVQKINSSRYDKLSTKEDLEGISDHDLLEACRRIGLLSDVNYRRLEHVNYMRNHASAAHPNESELDGYEILSWLRSCLKYAITAEPNQPVIRVKQLLTNVRSEKIPENDIPHIGTEIAKLPQQRIDDLLWTLFGMYTDPKLNEDPKVNIANLAPHVWTASTEDQKFEVGARFGIFRKNGEVKRKNLAEEFLNKVDGTRYKDEDSLAGELIEKLETLKSVHFATNNFYNEYPHARSLASSIPQSGEVPRAARPMWVKVVSLGYIGNGRGYKKGVDENALPFYKRYINRFGDSEIVVFLRLMEDSEFTNDFSRSMADKRAKQLAGYLKDKTSNVHIKRALELTSSFTSTLDRISGTSEYREALKHLPEID